MLTRDDLNDKTFDIWMWSQAIRDKFKLGHYSEMIAVAEVAKVCIDDLLSAWENAEKARTNGSETD
jgi:hypothetical protein